MEPPSIMCVFLCFTVVVGSYLIAPLVMKQELKKRAEAIRGELAAVSPASNDSNALALTVENSRQSKTSPMDPQVR